MLKRQLICFIILIFLFFAGNGSHQDCLASEPTITELTAQLKDPNAKVRKKAATKLGETKSLEAVPPLLSAATDPDPGVRENVVKSLGLLKDPSAVTMLLTTLQDSDENVRTQSIIALVSLYLDREAEFIVTKVSKKVYKTVNPFSDQIGKDPTVIEAYVKVPRSVIDGIADHLVDPSSDIRNDAARSLGVLRAQPAIPKMLDAMKTGNENLKIAILRSLVKIKDPSVDEALMPYLKDANKDVRVETLVTLGLLRSKKALPEMQSIYDQNPDTKLRLIAFQAISMVGDPSSLNLFVQKLKDPDKPYRIAAAEGIARVGDKSATEAVSSRLYQGKRVWLSARDELCALSIGAQGVH